LVCDQISAPAAEECAAGALHTLSFPQGEARGHKVMIRQDDVEGMARAMGAALDTVKGPRSEKGLGKQ